MMQSFSFGCILVGRCLGYFCVGQNFRLLARVDNWVEKIRVVFSFQLDKENPPQLDIR